MLIEPVVFNTALSFLTSYIAEKGLDKFVNTKINNNEEMSIEEHVYSVLTESLADFCAICNFEFDENSITETLIFSHEQINQLTRDEQLKLILERATGLEITPEELKIWNVIVQEHLVSDKHEKLFRAIQLKSLEEKNDNFVEPSWMQKHMSNNSIAVTFKETGFDKLFLDIKTVLSDDCWLQTQDLIIELSLNAFSHGNAKEIILKISEKEIQIVDDGTLFDTKKLLSMNKTLSGGQWTINRFINSYPEVTVSYETIDQKNATLIQFQEKVFNVNGLCEIILPKTIITRSTDIQLRYPNGKAKYYYIDFSEFATGRSFMCMSGSLAFVSKLNKFCASYNTEIFVYIPKNSLVLDDFDEKMTISLDCEPYSDKIHIIRE